MQSKIQRSMLILPVNVQKFVEKAHTRGADAILLDIEDAVPVSEKEHARSLVKNSIRLAGKGGSDVLVRVNNDPEMVTQDLEASIHDGLSGIFLPKTEAPEQVAQLENVIGFLENSRGLEPGSIRVSIHIESPMGILKLREIVEAGSRIESLSMGVDDYCLEMGIRPSSSASELVFPMTTIAMVARAFNLLPLGILGSVANFREMDKFRLCAQNARDMGFSGAYCIHPDQVKVLNEVFSPANEEVVWAGRVVECFEEALARGRASTSLDGKMVDTPIYKQALAVLKAAHAVEVVEDRKRAAQSSGSVEP